MTTGKAAKSLSRPSHSRIDELPTNSTPPGGGACFSSAAANAAIGASHIAVAGGMAGEAAQTKLGKASNRASKKGMVVDFKRDIVNNAAASQPMTRRNRIVPGSRRPGGG